MRIQAKTGSFTYDSVEINTAWSSHTVNIFYMKTNSPLKEWFTSNFGRKWPYGV